MSVLSYLQLYVREIPNDSSIIMTEQASYPVYFWWKWHGKCIYCKISDGEILSEALETTLFFSNYFAMFISELFFKCPESRYHFTNEEKLHAIMGEIKKFSHLRNNSIQVKPNNFLEFCTSYSWIFIIAYPTHPNPHTNGRPNPHTNGRDEVFFYYIWDITDKFVEKQEIKF